MNQRNCKLQNMGKNVVKKEFFQETCFVFVSQNSLRPRNSLSLVRSPANTTQTLNVWMWRSNEGDCVIKKLEERRGSEKRCKRSRAHLRTECVRRPPKKTPFWLFSLFLSKIKKGTPDEARSARPTFSGARKDRHARQFYFPCSCSFRL